VYRKVINDIIIDKEEIGMAATLLREISKDERERAILRSRRMAETDLISNLLTAEERGEIKGEARGIAKGEAKGRAEIIALLKKGFSLEEIEKMVNAEKI
jgi:recombinational DNA repair protein (RecF pathway)